jgi:hypothetical protein
MDNASNNSVYILPNEISSINELNEEDLFIH